MYFNSISYSALLSYYISILFLDKNETLIDSFGLNSMMLIFLVLSSDIFSNFNNSSSMLIGLEILVYATSL